LIPTSSASKRKCWMPRNLVVETPAAVSGFGFSTYDNSDSGMRQSSSKNLLPPIGKMCVSWYHRICSGSSSDQHLCRMRAGTSKALLSKGKSSSSLNSSRSSVSSNHSSRGHINVRVVPAFFVIVCLAAGAAAKKYYVYFYAVCSLL